MRASREVKAQHHDTIVAAAAKMLRRCGIDRTSVVDLMRASGLTHGGFYRHFKSKDQLVAQSTQNIFQALVSTFQARAAKTGARAALVAYVDEYLCDRHVKTPAEGCAVAAYGAEAARESGMVRKAFADGMDRLLALVEDGMPGPKEQRRARALELQAMMAGAVVMARAAGNATFAHEILDVARQRAARMIDATR